MSTVQLGNAYEAVIGLEVHVQLRTRSKIFCRCATGFGAPPNTQVCPVCLGHPGVLPVLNREAVAFAIRFGLAVNGEIAPVSRFARKNYFYPDLPKGYQISQYDAPVLVGGSVPFRVGETEHTLRLTRAHLEEDAGKSFHPEDGREATSLIDLNRSGVPLLEVVSEPDLRSPAEAHACMERIHQLVVYLGICDGNMEEGSLRCDANISVRPRGETELYPKVEIKNLNSFRNVERSLNWEFKRQSRLLEDGERAVQETRSWDDGEARTRTLRSKEEAHDYRYFPEPDVPPLCVDPGWIASVAAGMAELPWVRERRLVEVYGLPVEDAVLLASTRPLGDYFERVAQGAGDPVRAANWMLSEVLREVKGTPNGVDDLAVQPEQLGALLRLVDAGTISGKIAKTVFAEMCRTGEDPGVLVERLGLVQISDPSALGSVVTEVLEAHPGPVADYLAGKEAALQFFVGQVMRATRGQANPELAREAVRAGLESRRGA